MYVKYLVISFHFNTYVKINNQIDELDMQDMDARISYFVGAKTGIKLI